MVFPLTSSQSRNCMMLTVMMITCLILLINTSFKIITLAGMTFSASSVLCALVACCYLLVLQQCTLTQQKHLLNLSLAALYLFSIGIYVLVNLPAADAMRDSYAYQIVFEDIPKKFFAATLAFGLSFYLPHCLQSMRKPQETIARKNLLFALLGGFCFFTLDFLLLFFDQKLPNFGAIYIDSLIVASEIMLVTGVGYLLYLLGNKSRNFAKALPPSPYLASIYYHYLVGFSVIIILICLACEYRLIAFGEHNIFAASGIFAPLLMIANNVVGEYYGYKANVRWVMVLLVTELAFDAVLVLTIILPSPNYFNLNAFYFSIMPRRIAVTTLILFTTYFCNTLAITVLKSHINSRGLRVFIANVITITLLCSGSYTLLYAGVYPYEQILNLALNGWVYNVSWVLLSLPIITRLPRLSLM